MKFGGFTKGGVDELLTTEQLDHKRRHAWLEFKGAMDKAIVAANREVLSKVKLTRDSFLRLALTAAELRVAYLNKGLEVGAARQPSAAQLDELTEARRRFEETAQVFEALERVIERGYVEIPTR